MSDTVTANINAAQCLKTMTGFGQDIVYNICNGTQQVVPWGALDWALGIFVFMVLIGAILCIIGFVAGVVWEVFF